MLWDYKTGIFHLYEVASVIKKFKSLFFPLLGFLITTLILFIGSEDNSSHYVKTGDFFILSAISFLISGIISFMKKQVFVFILFFVKLVVYNIMCLLFLNYYPLITGILFSSFYWELNSYIQFPVNAAAAAASLCITFFIYTFFHSFEQLKITLFDMDIFISALMIIGSIILSISRKRLMVKIDKDKKTINSLDSAINQLTRSNVNFLNYANLVKQQTIQDERKQITGELHDIIGHPLTNIISMIDVVLKNPLTNPVEQTKLNYWIRNQSQKCLKNTRAALYQLRNLDNDESLGIHALNNLIHTFSFATKVEVECEWGNISWNLPSEINTAIYRTVQEALINAFKHGKASHISISFWVDSRFLLLTIRDNGIGGKSEKMGIGQSSMIERIEGLGGTIDFNNGNYGYTISVKIPLKDVDLYEKN